MFMALAEGSDICDIASNLSKNGSGLEGDEFEFCKLKGAKFHLRNPCDPNHSFVSPFANVEVREMSIPSVFATIMSMPAFIMPNTMFPVSLEK